MTQESPLATAPELKPTDCPMCGAADAPEYVVTRDWLFHVPGEYAISRCRNCGHFFLNVLLTKQSLIS